jgi:small basic protein
MRLAPVLLAVVTLVTIGTAEALVSNAQLAELPGRGRPPLSGGGAALTLAGIALSVAAYAVLGVVLARGGAPESSVLPTGMAVGAAAGLIGGTIRAYLIRDYLGNVLASFGLGDLLLVTLAVFVALSVGVSFAAGAALTWLSFRGWRRRPRSRPPS